MAHDTDKIEQDVREALNEGSAAITERVRKITLNALSEGELDGATLKQVMEAVVKGARQGLNLPDENSAIAIQDAIRGLDEALAAAATATHLAVQEAAGRTNEFSRESLKKSFDELATLETQFLNTLGEAAQQSSGHVKSTLQDIADHARTSGTIIGGQVKTALEQLAHAVADTTREQVSAGTQTLRDETTLLASLAAGVLKGIADRLQPPDKPD